MLKRKSVLVAVALALFFISAARGQNDLAGTWTGTLPKADLPLVFKFKADGSGTVDSTKQHFHSKASISVNGKDVTISVPEVQGTFTGTLRGEKMSGTWSQGSGYTDDLVLEKQ